MGVYVLQEGADYEGDDILAVFDDLGATKDWAQNDLLNRHPPPNDFHYRIDQLCLNWPEGPHITHWLRHPWHQWT